MKQFDFTTNIEKRMPGTGEVYMIDRMTSEYAERWPFDVDQFIEDVYQEFAGTEFEEHREALRKVWTSTMSMPVQGDKTVYPNNSGVRRPAAVKVWLMAGDYWRRGLRPGDVLPKKVPATKITRLDDGRWIALFPKDMHLLDEWRSTAAVLTEHTEDSASCVIENDTEGTAPMCDEESEVPAPARKPVAAEPRQMELFADEDDTEGTAPVCEEETVSASAPTPAQSQRERNAECRRRRMEQRERQRMDYEARLEREAREAEDAARSEEHRKIFAMVGAVVVMAVMVYFFGLLGPAVFGLLAGGLLKG